MTLRRCAVALVVLAVTVVVWIPGAAAQLSKPRAELPTYSLGEQWIRNDGVYELIRIEPDRYVFAGRGFEIYLARDLAPLAVSPAPKLAWPLEVGRRGSIETRAEVPGWFGFGTLEWSVDRFETVDVPAGKFDAFRVHFTMQIKSSGGPASNFGRGSVPTPTYTRPNRWTFTMWYAPAARQWIKSESAEVSQLRFEVVALDPGDTAPLQILLQSPKDQADVEPTESLELVGRVSGGKGVAQVTVSVNGANVFSEQPKGDPKRTVVLQVPLKNFRGGKNVVLVTATDPAGTMSQEARTLMYSAPIPIELPSPGQRLSVPGRHLVLRGTVTDAAGLTYYTLSVNEVEAHTKIVMGDVSSSFEDWDVKLAPGPNVLRLRIRTKSGGMRIEDRTVIVDPLAPAPGPLVAAAPPPDEAAMQAAEEAAKKLAEAEARTLAEAKERAELAARQAAENAAKKVAEADAKRRAEVAARQAAEEAAKKLAEAEAKRQAEAAARQAALAVVAAVPTPLQIRIAAPSNASRVEHDSIALAGLVSGGKGIRRVIVSLNGGEITRLEERAPQPAVAVSLPMTLREGQNTLVITAIDTDGVPYQDVRTVYYEKVVPLAVTFTYPNDRAKMTQESTVVVASLLSSKGIARVNVTLNGTPIHDQQEKTPRKTVPLTLAVNLKPGTNTIVVAASEDDGTTRQEVRTVVYEPPVMAAVAPPLPALPRRDRWAVVIGVGDYEHPSIPRLRYTVADADAIYQTLTGLGGFKKENVLLLTDHSPRKPTLRNIKWALGTFLARSAHKDDTVIIFYAGHGAPEVDPRGVERDGLAKYIIPSDADPEDLFSTALPMDDLQTIFGRIESDRVVAFLDACYSGAAGGRTFASKKSRAVNVDESFLDRLTASKGRAIVTASRTSEVSIELDDLKHGLFTYYLVEGLKGAADADRDGVVTLQELYVYVEQQVSRRSRALGGNQHPVMKGELEGVLPLMQLKKR